MTTERNPSLLARLFDLGFNRFVALSLVRIVYVLLMVAGLAGLAFAATYLFQVGQQETTIAALLIVLLGPVVFFIYLLVLRLLCETLIVVFVMAENLEQLRVALQATRKDPSQST